MWSDDESIIKICIPASRLVCGLFYSFGLEVFHVEVGDDWREWRAHGDPAYRKITKDPTDSIEWKTTALLKKSSITEETRRQLCPAGSRPPTLYGLSKVHKEGIPLRPIVSNIGAPTYQLSKHLSGLLNQYTGKTAHHVKNSFHFIRILESLKNKTWRPHGQL